MKEVSSSLPRRCLRFAPTSAPDGRMTKSRDDGRLSSSRDNKRETDNQDRDDTNLVESSWGERDSRV